jgi:hypothetical protein
MRLAVWCGDAQRYRSLVSLQILVLDAEDMNDDKGTVGG